MNYYRKESPPPPKKEVIEHSLKTVKCVALKLKTWGLVVKMATTSLSGGSSGHGGHAFLHLDQNVFIFMHSSEKIGHIGCWRPPQGLVPRLWEILVSSLVDLRYCTTSMTIFRQRKKEVNRHYLDQCLY